MFTTTVMYALLLLLALTGAPQNSAPAQQKANTRNPHGNLAIPCENCHTFTSWKPIRSRPEFSHDKTRYPLRGMHEGVECRQCHTNLVFTNVGNKCADCHADIHRRQFAATCEQCHTVKGWRVALNEVKQHQNRFPLLGAHAAAECSDCHQSAAVGQFRGLSTSCMGCHAAAFVAAKSPDHRAAGFPSTCETCHVSLDTWMGAKFDHSQYAGFALNGAHTQLACTSCHIGGRYAGTPANCIGCHRNDFTAAKNPDHVQAGFPEDCARCHNTATWAGARFDHNVFTSFPLTGMHVSLACAQCHTNGRFAGTPKDCASCHLSDYQKTTNPNHAAAGFPQDCSLCHSTSGWAGAKFDHSRTQFPLTGAHIGLTCTTCHVGGKYTGLDPACVSCHLTNFQRTTNPNHVAAGFPQQCAVCHSTTAWTPAAFDHSRTAFPLNGAHTGVACASCHIGGRYAGTPTDCYSCHRTEYQSVTNPNHIAAGFPTTCATCHTTTTWSGARFNHTWFPIYSGTHAGKWTTCNDCHVNPSNFAVFSCLGCHLKTRTDEQHKDVRNYVYNSNNCYSCHPQGRN